MQKRWKANCNINTLHPYRNSDDFPNILESEENSNADRSKRNTSSKVKKTKEEVDKDIDSLNSSFKKLIKLL
jgi:hypothetical protein